MKIQDELIVLNLYINKKIKRSIVIYSSVHKEKIKQTIERRTKYLSFAAQHFLNKDISS